MGQLGKPRRGCGGVSGLGYCGVSSHGAKRAADQTRKAIADVLTFGSGNRASTQIQEIKYVLQKGRWEVGYHLCHTLRTLLADLKTPGLSLQQNQSIDNAVISLTEIENALDAAIRKDREPRGADRFNASLSSIQVIIDDIFRDAASGRGG